MYALALVLSVPMAAWAQEGASFRFPARLATPDEALPQSVTITTPSDAAVQTDADTIDISGNYTNLIATITWTNLTTMATGDAVLDPVNLTYTVTVPAANLQVDDSFTSDSTVALTAHSPDTGMTWTVLRADAREVRASVSDYAVPSGSEGSGTAMLIVEATPATGISGNNYNLFLKLSSAGPWSISTGANTALMFGLVDSTAASEDYCLLELFSSAVNPDARLVKVVAGTPTVLDFDNVAPVNGQVWEVRRRGNVFTAYQDGVERLTATDAACAASKRTGMGFGGVYPGSGKLISTGAKVDDFRLEDPDAAASGVSLMADTTQIIEIEGCKADMVTCYTDRITVTQGAADDVDPTGTVDSPTSALTYSTDVAAITWTGQASDNVGVFSVVVGCAVCTPTSSTAVLTLGVWQDTGFTMVDTDPNVFTFTITDTNGNVTTLPNRTVTLSAAADVTAPTVSILLPESDGTSTTSNSSASLSGEADDNVALRMTNPITYQSNGCGSGNANGSYAWSIPTLTLTANCTVDVYAHDAAGLTSTAATHVFTYTPALSIVSPPSLTAVVGQAFSYCFAVSGGTAPYTIAKVSGTYPTGLTLTAGCLTGTPGMGTEGNYSLHSYSATDNVAAKVTTNSFTVTIGSDALGGQNNSYHDSVCGHADNIVCKPLRDQTQLNGLTSGTNYLNTYTGKRTWEYNPAADTDPQRQDAAKHTFHGWRPYSTAKTLAQNLDAPAQYTIQLISFSSTAVMGSGRAIRIDNEILACVHPTGASNCLVTGGVQGYFMRGAYGSTVATHTSGAAVLGNFNGTSNSLIIPFTIATTTSDTYLLTWDNFFTSSMGGMASPRTCAGLGPGFPGSASNVCAQQGGGYKMWTMRIGGSKNQEFKVTTAGHNDQKPNPATYDVVSPGGDIGWIALRNYTAIGPPHGGDDGVRQMEDESFIFREGVWGRYWIELEINHDQNLDSFGRLSDITDAMDASLSDKTVMYDHTVLTLFSDVYNIVWSSSGDFLGRRILIDDELMAIESCDVSSTDSPNPRTCTVTRAVDGTTLAAHSIGADFKLNWYYYSVWVATEDVAPTLIFDRVPFTPTRNKTTGQPIGSSQFYIELDDSQARALQHVADINFADMSFYTKNFNVLKRSGTGNAGGAAGLPAEWASFLIKPTVNGN